MYFFFVMHIEGAFYVLLIWIIVDFLFFILCELRYLTFVFYAVIFCAVEGGNNVVWEVH